MRGLGDVDSRTPCPLSAAGGSHSKPRLCVRSTTTASVIDGLAREGDANPAFLQFGLSVVPEPFSTGSLLGPPGEPAPPPPDEPAAGGAL
jgi:hypothetical protein